MFFSVSSYIRKNKQTRKYKEKTTDMKKKKAWNCIIFNMKYIVHYILHIEYYASNRSAYEHAPLMTPLF